MLVLLHSFITMSLSSFPFPMLHKRFTHNESIEFILTIMCTNTKHSLIQYNFKLNLFYTTPSRIFYTDFLSIFLSFFLKFMIDSLSSYLYMQYIFYLLFSLCQCFSSLFFHFWVCFLMVFVTIVVIYVCIII